MEFTTFTPDLSAIIKWLIFSALLLIVSIVFVIRFIKPVPAGTSNRTRPLFFLLSGFTGLIALTIFCFMLFNYSRLDDIKISENQLSIGNQEIPLSSIRRTQIHREGSGIPFQGIGVEKGTNNSLIIELTEGPAIVISEDFYPVKKISDHIKNKLKKKKD